MTFATSRGKENNKSIRLLGKYVDRELLGHLSIFGLSSTENIFYGDQKVLNGPRRKIKRKK